MLIQFCISSVEGHLPNTILYLFPFRGVLHLPPFLIRLVVTFFSHVCREMNVYFAKLSYHHRLFSPSFFPVSSRANRCTHTHEKERETATLIKGGEWGNSLIWKGWDWFENGVVVSRRTKEEGYSVHQSPTRRRCLKAREFRRQEK